MSKEVDSLGRELVAEQLRAKKRLADEKRAEEKAKSAVSDAVLAWAAAWSSKNANAYIAFYGADFTPPKKLSRAAWEAQRSVRLAKPKYIKVKVSKMTVTMLGGDHAQVEFRQGYESDTYRDEVGKLLILKKVGSKWLITQEQSK